MPRRPEEFVKVARDIIANVRDAQHKPESASYIADILNGLDNVDKCKLILVMALALDEVNEMMDEDVKELRGPAN